MAKQTYISAHVPQPAGPYSHIVTSNGLAYTAGFGPQDPQTGKIAGDTVYEQTQQVLNNVSAALQVVGADLSSIIKVNVYLQDIEHDFAEFNKAYADFFHDNYPVRTTVGASLSGILVEIDAIAELPERDDS